jgi:hypothetical protein
VKGKAALINQATGKMPRLFGMLEICVRNGKFEPRQGAPEYGYPTLGYDIMRPLVRLRKVLKDLRRAELVAAKEHDRIRAAARGGTGDGTSVQRPPTSDTHGRKQSGTDRLRHESSQALDNAEYDKVADDMSNQEALVEELAEQASRDLQAGRETAERVREEALDTIETATAAYEPGSGTMQEEADKATAFATKASVDTQAIEAAFSAKVMELSAVHRAAMAEVDELHLALDQSEDRTRRIRQRTTIRNAITEVQVRAANQRKGTAEPEEDLHNDTVTKDWKPILFNGMIGSDADPDVKRMALEAAERAHINQIYPDGAFDQQWDALIADYKIRQILWIRDNPGKLPGGTQRHSGSHQQAPPRQPAMRSDAQSTCAGGNATTRSSTWWPAAGGTGCSEGSHNPNSM